MSVLAEIVKSILVIIILASFLEMLLPDGEVKPFVRFAIGLFILIAILNPSLAYLFDNRDFQIKLWDYRVDARDTEDIMEDGREINRELFKDHNEVMQEKLQGQISAVAMLVPGVDGVDSRVQISEEGALEKLKLVVRSEQSDEDEKDPNINVFSKNEESINELEQTQIKEKILTVVKNLYGLKGVDIEIEFEGG